ncbi:hypothetical protein MPSEU_000398000 [Mayamaea pseudoterrestris]|nr:hypothetical protein MPSEU_000398000 [Mayamaea pseudoterrestris]
MSNVFRYLYVRPLLPIANRIALHCFLPKAFPSTMGNAASKSQPIMVASSTRRPNHRDRHAKNLSPPPPAPPLWKNHERFEIISPASDLSNPSNLDRLRKANHGNKRAQQTPVRERRRTSKVMATRNGTGRLVTNQRTSLPPPDRFYFASTAASKQHLLNPATIREEDENAHGNHDASRNQKTLSLTRAKQVLQGCLQVTKQRTHEKLDSIPPSIDVMQPMEPLSEIRQPRARRSSTTKETDDTQEDEEHHYANIVQFDPTLACHVMTIDNPYLHSEDNYFKSLSSSNQVNGSAQDSPQQQHTLIREYSYAPPSPVAQLFDDSNIGNYNIHELLDMKKRHDKWLAHVLDIHKMNKNAWLEAKRLRQAARKKQSLESAATDETTTTTADQRGRVSQDSETFVKPATVTDDAAAVTENALEPLETRRLSAADEFRLSIESNVQQQIDQQIAKRQTIDSDASRNSRRGRVQEIQNRYQQDLDRISNPQGKMIHRAKDFSNLEHVSRVQEKRELFERKLVRSNSLPMTSSKRTSQGTMTQNRPRANNRRSSSVPPSNPSNAQRTTKQEIPALLLLAGWKPSAVTASLFKEETKPKKEKKKVDKLPALLKLAGWQDNNGSSKSKMRFSIQSALPRLQRNKRISMTFTNRVSRKSEPIPSSKPVPGASKSRRLVVQNRKSVSSFTAKTVQPPANTAGCRSSELSDSEQQLAIPCDPIIDAAPKTIGPTTGSGLTTAFMLQQTYAICAAESANGVSVRASLDKMRSTTIEQETMLSESDVRSMLPPKASRISSAYQSNKKEHAVTALVVASPVMSLCSLDTQQTTNSHSPPPVVSHQATSNASFLFSDAENAAKTPAPRSSNDFNISTIASLKRLPGSGSLDNHAYTIPSNRTSKSSETTRESTDRRVRFSEVIGMKSPFRAASAVDIHSIAVHPGIESRVSDLTDHGDFMHVRVSDPPEIDAIPEETSIDQADKALDAEERSESSYEKFDSRDDEDARVMVQPAMRWSYQTSDGKDLGVGVTPMRKGVSTGHVTSSPMLRFKEARSKFSVAAATRKPSPVKRQSPTKQVIVGGLVSARVAALMVEQARSRNQTPTPPSSQLDVSSKIRQLSATQLFLTGAQLSRDESTPSPPNQTFHNSPMLINGKVVDSPTGSNVSTEESTVAATVVNEQRNQNVAGVYTDKCSPSGSEGSADPFACITLSKTFDEDSDSNAASTGFDIAAGSNFYRASVSSHENQEENDDDEDAFAELLNNEHTTGASTVSTVRNESHTYAASGALLNSFASQLTRRVNNCKHSVGSSASTASSRATESIASIMSRKRLSFASSGEISLPTNDSEATKQGLAFRDDAPVRPTEQKQHRLAHGSLGLSPMQRTPMQACKWRVLAAAAHEKDRKAQGIRRRSSLQERHPNVHASAS